MLYWYYITTPILKNIKTDWNTLFTYNLPAFALVLNLDLILAGFGRGRRNILLFPDEIVLKGLLSFIAVGLSLQNRHSKSKSFERWGSYDLYFVAFLSSTHSFSWEMKKLALSSIRGRRGKFKSSFSIRRMHQTQKIRPDFRPTPISGRNSGQLQYPAHL